MRATAVKIAEMWEKLEVDPASLLIHPTITPILINGLGAIDKVIIPYLRGSDDKFAIELVRLWDLGTKQEHKEVPFEGYCLAAKSTPKKMMGIIMQTVVEQADVATEFMLATAKTAVVGKTIKLAKTTKGYDERKIILQNRGVMAAPKNQVFNNFGSVNQDNRKQIANVSVSQLDEDNDKISAAVDQFNAQRVLKAGTVPVIDATLEDE